MADSDNYIETEKEGACPGTDDQFVGIVFLQPLELVIRDTISPMKLPCPELF